MKKYGNILHLFIGIIIFSGFTLLLPDEIFNLSQRYVVSTLMVMIYFWITRPVDLAVTALLPIVINSVLIMAPMDSILKDYFSPIVVLIIGANILTATWELWGLDKRIALKALSHIGILVNQQIFIWFMLSVVLSMFLPNVVVVSILCPIAYAMMKYCSDEKIDYTKTSTSYLLLLAIAWGAGLGGMGTPLGGSMNLVVLAHIENYIGSEFSFIKWTYQMVPFMIIISAAVIFYMRMIKKDIKKLPGSNEYFQRQLSDIGKISKPEIISLLLFSFALVLSFARPLYQELLPNLQPQYVFLIVGLSSFFIKADKKNYLISWTYAVKNIKWGLILLFSGGLAIGKLIVDTGVATSLANLISNSGFVNEIFLLGLFIGFAFFLANASSNTAACAVLIPIVIAITKNLSLNTMAYVFISAAACNVAYLLPTSIRAVPTDYGLDAKYMFKKGVAAVVISYIVLLAAGILRIGL